MKGSPFTGIGFAGYDNHTQKYLSTWMDSMGTPRRGTDDYSDAWVPGQLSTKNEN